MVLFDHYHGGPCGGHMGEYKTLYRLRLRFFWSGMRELIRDWVAACAHCLIYNAWCTCSSELRFSWPVIIILWIMYIDLWSPGATETDDGKR